MSVAGGPNHIKEEFKFMETKSIILGYIRVSTDEQSLNRQITAIKGYKGIEDINIFTDKQTGKNFEREGYIALKGFISNYRRLFSKDELTIELVIKELDRLGRDYKGIMSELQWFRDNGVIVRILEIPLTLQEVNSEQGWLLDMTLNIIIEVYARLAQQEIEKRAQRQKEGIAEARKQGVRFGRPEIQIDQKRFIEISRRALAGEITHKQAMENLGLKRNTYYKKLNTLVPNWKIS